MQEVMPVRLGEGVTPPEVLKRVRPEFGDCAGDALSARPVVEVIVDEAGAVRDAHMLSPTSPCLEKVILSSIRQSKFRPASIDGKPVAVVFNITVLVEKH
jgi:protein TonB